MEPLTTILLPITGRDTCVLSLQKNHAGILLDGDHTSQTWLHEVIHDVTDRSLVVIGKEGAFLELAYDARKAFEQQREVLEPPKDFAEVGVRYGER